MRYLYISLLSLFATGCLAQDAATIVHNHDSLVLVYHGVPVFSGKVVTRDVGYAIRQETQIVKGCTWQIITIRAGDMKPFGLDGRIMGGDDAIACESDPVDGRIKVVRQVVGRSHSLLNNAVYQRRNDWLLSVDNYYSKVKVAPANDTDYEIDITGWEIVIRFRPGYYKEHRGLSYFDPSTYSVWKEPVVGWCSWFAYLDQVNEQEVKETADVISAKLRPFGLRYLQIDDGYEQQPIGLPDTWLHANRKFPSGLRQLAAYIGSKGLTPGIWTNVTFADSAAAEANKSLFVEDERSRPASGNWIGYVMDGSNPETIQRLITPVYKGLNEDGFGYFKLDALRHLKYEGYNSFAGYFAQRNIDRNKAYRNVAGAVREQAGKGKFLLACWGIRPELVGIADGCRIGNDGFSYAGLAQFNSYNNIIWRNDPDHIVLSAKEAYRSCSATSLTGSLFMLTDKAETYRHSPLIEAARRTIPVLYTQPGQVYDVDPSRSSLIAGADVEMSGSGPRAFDASGSTTTGLLELEINKPFENWVVLGRLDDRDKVVPFRELGLDNEKEYLVFEFWSKKFCGVFKTQWIPGNIDTAYNCQVFCIREKLEHPQLLATNRHISCGGLEIGKLDWKDNSLEGVSELVANDKYVIYVYEGGAYTFDAAHLKGAVLISNEKVGSVREITMVSSEGGTVEWTVSYVAGPGGIRLQEAYTRSDTDWLVTPIQRKAAIYRQGNEVVLDNGLLRRVFRIAPNVACVDYVNLTNGQQLLRSVKPEARLILDGKAYNVGGLEGQRENAYLLPSWVDSMTAGKEDFQYVRYSMGNLEPFLKWKRRAWAPDAPPVTGKTISFEYASPLPTLKGVRVWVHYELYDGIPLIVKWVSVENGGQHPIKIDRVVNEVLGLVEEESAVVGTTEEMKKQHGIYVETNYAFNNAMRYDISDQTTHWIADSSYTSQVNYNFQTPCLLEVYPEKAPGIALEPGKQLASVRTHELLMDSYDRQRRGLIIKRMYRAVAPWTTQNPIFMHLVSRTDADVRQAVDQCAATGYEAVILSFGSHLDMEDSSAANLARWAGLAEYAHRKGILIGGYSLFSSRHISDEDDVIDPRTGKPGGAFFGYAPCFGSKWGLAYRDKIKLFFTRTGFDIWENDGPYPGDVCASTTHPGHKGLDDSQWRQMEIQKELYHWLNERGIYINAPDWYFLDGTNKIAIGYREVNFSLPRQEQLILNRQNIYDGTQEKTGAMSWGFVPLTKYQGGGPEAVLEPLHEHLDAYKQLMIQYYGAGVQACYRGPRLFDTDSTEKMVSAMIQWYKEHRDILNSDMIQLRRADGRDWDGWMHVNPTLKEKGLILLFNPTKERITRTIRLSLYYTGLRQKANIVDQDGRPASYDLGDDDTIAFPFSIEPESYRWFVIK